MQNGTLVVVIPAHNEESSIQATVAPYLKLLESNEKALRVIIACNACTDSTYERVKSIKGVIALNIEKAGKANAINEAIKLLAPNEHVMVQDADAVISEVGIQRVLHHIRSRDFSLLAPEPEYANSASWLVRQYYRFLFSTTAFKSGMVGAGVYLIHAKHVPQLYPMPEIIADDGYVKFKLIDQLFAKMTDVRASITPPQDFASLVKIRTRSRLGNMQLSAFMSTQSKEHRNSLANLLLGALKSGKLVSALVYLFVNVIAVWRAKRQYALKKFVWERDDSSRRTV